MVRFISGQKKKKNLRHLKNKNKKDDEFFFVFDSIPLSWFYFILKCSRIIPLYNLQNFEPLFV